jgi:drug/metabolite transporter (DMT)-like permease
MKAQNLLELVTLAGLWGASFLFMRMGAAEFGPAALVFVRVAGAAALLLPLLLFKGQGAALRQHWKPIAVVGIANSAIPFTCFVVAALVLNASLMSVFNATAPIWGALIAWLWLGDKLGPSRSLGLAVGLAGTVALAWGKADLKPGTHGISPALGIAACLLATLLYGWSINFTRKRLSGVPPLAIATGSQCSAALALALPALWAWPQVAPSANAWWAAAALAIGCTGLAYLLFFRLIARAGSSYAISVTFLLPAFATLWGWLFLAEVPTTRMWVGGAVILLGTALATGTLKLPTRKPE